MSTAAQAMFSCSTCKKQYKWKPEFAGKKVKCKCGNVMTAPQKPPVAGEDDDAGMYDLAEDTPAAKPAAAAPGIAPRAPAAPTARKAAPVAAKAGARVGAVVAPPASSGAPKSPMLGYASMAKKADPETDEAERKGAILDLYVPAGLVVIGLVAAVFQYTQFDRITFSLAAALPRIAIELVIGFILTGAGCLAAIKLMDIAFGAPGPAALKLTAIVIFPAPVAAIIAYAIHDTTGFMDWAIGIVIFFSLFKLLFGLDLGEILLLSCILTIVRMWLGLLIAGVLIEVLLHGGGGMAMSAMSQAAVNMDRIAQDEIDQGRAVDAKEWLGVQMGRVFIHVGRDGCDAFMKEIFDDGAKQAWVLHSGPEAHVLIVELPRDTTKRTKIFQAESNLATKYQLGPPVKDGGQKYMVIDF